MGCGFPLEVHPTLLQVGFQLVFVAFPLYASFPVPDESSAYISCRTQLSAEGGIAIVFGIGRSQGWIPRRVVRAYDVVNASYLPTTINIYDLEIRSINNYRKSYDIASFLVSTNISRRCRFGNSKPCKYIRSSYVRRNCIYDNNRVSANISSYDYR